ncbi:group 1 glycosyl transferase [Halobacteriales archaeon QS_4_62_28]|nr:MAG: group 1 glycosyl transferase [Halobacteriales archaeon QS_4_62_28]
MADDDVSVAFGDLDVALAHWHIDAWGGAEYLVTKLAESLDIGTVYTTGEPSPDDTNPYGDVIFHDVIGDLSLPSLRRLQSKAGRVFEYALWEDIDWREYGGPDVLITSGSTTRAVITPDSTLHANYCHSTPRWFYDLYHDRKGSPVGILARPLVRYLRMRDMTVDPRVDYYFANSPIIARRLRKYYNRDAEVLYPPVSLERYHNEGNDGYYLHLGRLDEEKGVPNIVRAFDGTEHCLVLAGGEGDIDEGCHSTIERAPNIDYRGFVSEAEKYDLLAHCQAVVFNGHNEDFGIVPIEANASGKPCLARDDGFPGVYIEDGKNGYRHDGRPAGIKTAVERFESEGLAGDPGAEVERFSTDGFEEQIKQSIIRQYERFRETTMVADYND